MKKIIILGFKIIMLSSLTSCATMFGGGKYNAYITVANNPRAEIKYKGDIIGVGDAFVKVKRRDADKFQFTVFEEGKKEQAYSYYSKVFRGWSLFGSIIGFSWGFIPLGVAVDGINGAWWKPDEKERGITKIDYNNYNYIVHYEGIEEKKNKVPRNKEESDIIYLINGSIIRGKIIEQVPNKTITIETKDGNIIVCEVEDIERILKERLDD